MIIVEGPDCVGKTTFCEMLEKMSDGWLEVVHYGPELAFSPMGKYIDLFRENHIADRFHISEHVYGNVCRSEPGVITDRVNYQRCCSALKAMGALTVIISAEPHEYSKLLDRHHSRGELFNRETCEKVNEAYNSHDVYNYADIRILVGDGQFPGAGYANRVLAVHNSRFGRYHVKHLQHIWRMV